MTSEGHDIRAALENLELQKRSLQSKKNELADLDLDIEEINARIADLQKNANGQDLQALSQIEKLDFQIEDEKRAANLLKEINISQRNLFISGRNSVGKDSSTLDNLIRCVLDAVSKEHCLPVSLANNRQSIEEDDKSTLEKIKRLKQALRIEESEDPKVTQNLVDQICGKVSELKLSRTEDQFILLDDESSCKSSSKLMLYEDSNNFFLLRKRPDWQETQESAYELISSLLNFELLDIVAKLSYTAKGISCLSDEETSLDKIHLALKAIKADLDQRKKSSESEADSFIQFLKENVPSDDTSPACDQIVAKQVSILVEQTGSSPSSSVDNPSIAANLLFLKSTLIKRCEALLNDECQRRKESTKSKIASNVKTGDALSSDMNKKRSEIALLDAELTAKQRELNTRKKEYEKRCKEIKQANKSFASQAAELDAQIAKLTEELNASMKLADVKQACSKEAKKAVGEARAKVHELRVALDELNKSKSQLDAKRDKLDESLMSLAKEHDALSKQTAELEKKKEISDAELKELESSSEKLSQWIGFLDDVYAELLNNRQLYREREQLRQVINDPNKSLNEKYKFLVSNVHLSRYHSTGLEAESQKSDALRRETFERCFEAVLAAPKLIKTNADKIELSGINLDFEECMTVVDNYVKAQLEAAGLGLKKDEQNGQLYLTASNTRVGQYLDKSFELPESMLDLLDTHIKAHYKIRVPKRSGQKQRLTEDVQVIDENGQLLSQLRMAGVLESLKIDYVKVLRCYASTIELAAGNNIYVDGRVKLHFPGINLGLVSAKNIVLAKDTEIDTSGQPGLPFRYDQAHGFEKEADKGKAGKDGEDGLDGFSGSNAGHFCLSAGNKIVNLEQVASIRCKGGDGSTGQKGGIGQKGGKGEDTGDAEAEPIGVCWFNPSFSIAFARIPGYDPATEDFSNIGEISGRGGDAGKSGLGGQKGFAGQLIITDNPDGSGTRFVNAKSPDSVEFSDNLSSLRDRLMDQKLIENANGCDGSKASADGVSGGDAGEPGVYGLDHVYCQSSILQTNSSIEKKGDYSNYLNEMPSFKNAPHNFYETNKHKFIQANIIENPQLFAKESSSFKTISKVAFATAIVALGVVTNVFAAPIVAAATGYFGFNIISGLIYRKGVEKGKEKKNRAQILFSNRYADLEPLRSEEECTQNPRRSVKSRGKQGKNSELKSESDRQNHSKSHESMANVFETESASLNAKAKMIGSDSARMEAIDSLANEHTRIVNEAEATRAISEETAADLNRMSAELAQLDEACTQKKREKAELNQKIDEIEQAIGRKMNSVSEQEQMLLQDIDAYLNGVSEQLQDRMRAEFAKISLSGREEVLQALRQSFSSLKADLEKEKAEMKEKRQAAKWSLDALARQKRDKQAELEALKQQEYAVILDKVRGEQKLAEIDELQKKLNAENQIDNQTEHQEEVMVMKEFDVKDLQESTETKAESTIETADELNARIEKLNRPTRSETVSKDEYNSLFVTLRDTTPTLDELIANVRDAAVSEQERSLLVAKVDFIVHVLRADHSLLQDAITSIEQRKQYKNKNDKENMKMMFQVENIFVNINLSSKKYLDFYLAELASRFFIRKRSFSSQSNENVPTVWIDFIEQCSLTVYYENPSNSQLSKLDKQMVFFFYRGTDAFVDSSNIQRTMSLLMAYVDQVNLISELKYSPLNVIRGNLNRFFRFLIRTLRRRMEKPVITLDALAELVVLIDVLNQNLERISQMPLWKSAELVAGELKLLRNVFAINTLKTFKEKIEELNKIYMDQNTNAYQRELCKQILPNKLHEMLLNSGLSLTEYEEIEQSILKAKNLINESSKQYLYYELRAKYPPPMQPNAARSDEKVVPSKEGFLIKYGARLSLDLQKTPGYDQILEKLLQDREAAKIYESFEHIVLGDLNAMNRQESFALYSKISGTLATLSKLEFMVSRHIETNFILNSPALRTWSGGVKQASEEFVDELRSALRERVVNLTQIGELVNAKLAFYDQMIALLKECQADGRRAFMVLQMARRANPIPNGASQPFTPGEAKMLKDEFGLQNPKTDFDAFEHVVFKICDLAVSIENQTNAPTDQKALEKIRGKLSAKMAKIEASSDSNVVLGTLKDYARTIKLAIDQEVIAEELKKVMTKNTKDLLKEIEAFIAKYPTISDQEVLQMLASSLEHVFGDAVEKRNNFILDLIDCQTSEDAKRLDCNKLVGLINSDELVSKRKYVELIDLAERVEAVGLSDQQCLTRFAELISNSLDQYRSLLLGEIDKLTEASSGDDRMLMSVKIIDEVIRGASEATRDNFAMLKSLHSSLNGFNLQHISQDSDDKEACFQKAAADFLSETQTIFKTRLLINGATSTDDLIYELPRLLLESNEFKAHDSSATDVMRNYVIYMNLRLVSDEKLDWERLEASISDLNRSLIKAEPTTFLEQLYEQSVTAGQLLDATLLLSVIKKFQKIFDIVDQLKRNCATSKDKIIESLMNGMETQNELVRKGRRLMALEFMAKLQNLATDHGCLHQAKILYIKLREQVEALTSAKEIESHLILSVNQEAMRTIIPKVLNNEQIEKELKDKFAKEGGTLDQQEELLFSLLFGDAKIKGEKCLLTQLIEQLTSGEAQKEAVLKQLVFIEQVLQYICFIDEDKQTMIDEFRHELTNALAQSELKDEELMAKAATIDHFLQDACHKVNYYITFIDRRENLTEAQAEDYKSDMNTLIDSVKSVMEKVDLIKKITDQFDLSRAKFVRETLSQLDELYIVMKKDECDRKTIKDQFKLINDQMDERRSYFDSTLKEQAKTNRILELFMNSADMAWDPPDNIAKEISELEKSAKLDLTNRDMLMKAASFLVVRLKEVIVTNILLLADSIDASVGQRLMEIVSDGFDQPELSPCQVLLALTSYSVALIEAKSLTFVDLNLKGVQIMSQLFSDEKSFIESQQTIGKYISEFASRVVEEKPVPQVKLRVAFELIAPVLFQESDLKIAIRKLMVNTKNQAIIGLLLDQLFKCVAYKPEQLAILKRVRMVLDNPTKENLFGKLWDFIVNLPNAAEHEKMVEGMTSILGLDWFIQNMLTAEEKAYCEYLETNQALKLIKANHISILLDTLENEFIISASQAMTSAVTKTIEKSVDLESGIKLLVNATYVEQLEKAFSSVATLLLFTGQEEQVIRSVNSIFIFKSYLLQSKELIASRLEWIELIKSLKERHERAELPLVELFSVLLFSRLYSDNCEPIIKLVKEPIVNGSEKLFFKRFLLQTLSQVLVKVGQDKSFSDLIDLIDQSTSSTPDHCEYLMLLIKKLSDVYLSGLKYEKSELVTLKSVISLTVTLRIYDHCRPDLQSNDKSSFGKLVETLRRLNILKWEHSLKVKKIKMELGRDKDDDELANDIIQIEKRRGEPLTQQLVNALKTQAGAHFDGQLLQFMVKMFKSNMWELNEKIIRDVLLAKPSTEWIELLKKRANEEKHKTLGVKDLISIMKQHQKEGEINFAIRHLLDHTNTDDDKTSVLERCIKKLDEIRKSPSKIAKIYLENDQPAKEARILDLKKEDILTWTREFKKLQKVNINSIENDAILELMAVISQACKLVQTFELRSTQKIALLCYIDSILNNNNGRLANISTGEGKSLITLSTAIAQLLIREGKVDILTSSEILAERDALESEPFFALFGLSVSNNCDGLANSDEKLRKERYERNDVIYGEIGHFQRDLLLTKYYNKGIRNELAKCLIIDEVDSMCIDNMCNTLYISHQIADLRELKDIYVYIWQAVNMPEHSEHTNRNVELVRAYVRRLIDDGQIEFPYTLRDFVDRRLMSWINNAYAAKLHIEEGNHYSVLESGRRMGECVINDLQTGVEQLNTQWSEGLQQFIQLKHTNKLNEESLKAIFMSNYIFFTHYGGNIYGMTGTLGAKLERELLNNAYGLDFYELPRFKKELNVRMEPVLVGNRTLWLAAIRSEVETSVASNRTIDAQEKLKFARYKSDAEAEVTELEKEVAKLKESIKTLKGPLEQVDETTKVEVDQELDALESKLESKREELANTLENFEDINGQAHQDQLRNPAGRACLIICENKRDVQDIVKALAVKHAHLYDYNGKMDGLRRLEESGRRKTKIASIRQLRPGDIIVATNVAGRGTDFKISKLLELNGGLHVVVSYVASNVRVELQAFGRSGRKGESGSGRMIVYDHRAKTSGLIDFNYLIDERDQREEQRLNDIRIKMIARVKLERALFERFAQLQEEVNRFFKSQVFVDSNSKWDTSWRDLQIKSLHNKWAFWLDQTSDAINNVYKSEEENRKAVFIQYHGFEKLVLNEIKRDDIDGISGLIDKPNELIKLAKLNIQSGNFRKAVDNCKTALKSSGLSTLGFAYYYQAMATMRPLKEADFDWEIVETLRQKYRGHEITLNEKRESAKLLKKAVVCFEREIERVQMRSMVLASVNAKKTNKGIGSSADYFSRSNANECGVVTVHLKAARSVLAQELNLDEMSQMIKGGFEIENSEASEIFQAIINDSSMQSEFKKQRISSKVKIKLHVAHENRTQLESALKANACLANLTSKNQVKEDISDKAVQIVLDNWTEGEMTALKAMGAETELELYAHDQLNPGKWKWFKFPSSHLYCKARILSEIRRLQTSQSNCISLSTREQCQANWLDSCLTSEKIWKMVEKIGLTKVDSYSLQTDNKDANNAWESVEVFGDGSAREKFKTSLLAEFEKRNGVLTKTQICKLLPDNLQAKTEFVVKSLVEKIILKPGLLYEFKPEKLKAINEYMSNIYVVSGTLAGLDFKDFGRLEKNQKKILETLAERYNSKLPFTKKNLAQLVSDGSNVMEEMVKEAPIETDTKVKKNLFFKAASFIGKKAKKMITSETKKVEENEPIDQVPDSASDIENDQDLAKEFYMLRKLLMLKGHTRNLHTHLNLSHSLNEFELSEIENWIEQLIELELFDAKAITLAPVDQLVGELKKAGAIRPLILKAKYNEADEQAKRIEDTLRKIVPSLVDELIKKHIKANTFVTDTEVESNGSGVLNNVMRIGRTAKRFFGSGPSPLSSRDDLIETKKAEETQKITNDIVEIFLSRLGSLKRHAKCQVMTAKLESFYRGGQMPREVVEYIQLRKDLVISITQHTGGWCWKAFGVAVFGAIQIAAGSFFMAWPILGPFSYHIGSALVSEGASDIIFAISNSGNITGRSYWNHKWVSMLITVASVGIGAYLSAGATPIASVAREQAARLGTGFMARLIGKKVIFEAGKAVFNYAKSLVIDKLAEFFTKEFFKSFKDTFMNLIRQSLGYASGMNTLRAKLADLLAHMKITQNADSSDAEMMNLLEDHVTECERKFGDSIFRQMSTLTSKIGGPIASQIGIASSNHQFSGLKLNEETQQLENTKVGQLAKIAEYIGRAIKLMSYCNTAYEIIAGVKNMLSEIASKLQIKIESLSTKTSKTASASTSATTNSQYQDNEELQMYREAPVPTKSSSGKNRDETQDDDENSNERNVNSGPMPVGQQVFNLEEQQELIQKGLDLVDQRLLGIFENKLKQEVASPLFNSMVDHVLEPVTAKLSNFFTKQFDDLKTQTLGYAEWKRRLDENSKEEGLELDLFKDHTESLLKTLSLESPIKSINLDQMKEGKVNVVIDGKMRTLDLANEDERNLIRTHFGAFGIRLLPSSDGSGNVCLSRPSFSEYIKSISADKMLNEYDLGILAAKEGRQIIVRQQDGTTKVIGPPSSDGKPPIYFQHQPGDSESSGHFMPIIKVGDSFILASGLKNFNNACSIESLLYTKRVEELLAEGHSPDKAFKMAEDALNQMNIEGQINEMKQFAMGNSGLRNMFLGRDHERSDAICGGRTITENEKYRKERLAEEFQVKLEDQISKHVRDRVEGLAKAVDDCNKFRKENPKIALARGAVFQDIRGNQQKKKSIPSKSFSQLPENITILDMKVGDFKDLDACHIQGFKFVLPGDLKNPQVVELNKKLDKTNILLACFNTGPDRIIDAAQIKCGNEAISQGLDEKQLKNNFISECYDRLSESSDLKKTTNAQKIVIMSYMNAFKQLK